MATTTTSNNNNHNPNTVAEDLSIPISPSTNTNDEYIHQMDSPDSQTNSCCIPLLGSIPSNSRDIAPPDVAKTTSTWGVVALVLQLLAFLLTLGGVVCSTMFDTFDGKMYYGFVVWKWFVLLMVILCGKMIIGLVLNVLLLLTGWKFSLNNNLHYYYYFAQVLQPSLLACIWITAILATWVLLFIKSAEATLNTTTNMVELVTFTLVAVDIGSLLWFIKTMLIKMLATSFSLDTMIDRIKVSVYDNSLLKTLLGDGTSRLLSEVDDKFTELEMIRQKKVSYLTMQKLLDIISVGGFSGMGATLLSIVMKGENGNSSSGTPVEISSKSEDTSICMAKKIYQNVVRNKADDHKKYIDKADFSKFMTEKQVKIVYPMFEVNENNQITLVAFSKYVVRVSKRRIALFNALRANSRLLIQLNNHVTVVLVVLVFVLWLILVKVEFRQVLIVFGSTIVASAFIIGDVCKQLLNDFIFVFSTNAFDAGDCCQFDDTPVIIEDTDLVTTTAFTLNNEVRYYPNAVLSKKIITNYTRSSRHRGDSVVFALDISTSEHKIETLRSNIKEYIENTPHYWQPDHHLVLEFDLAKEGKMKATLQFKHNINHYEFTEIKARKTKLIQKLKEFLQELSKTPSNDTLVA